MPSTWNGQMEDNDEGYDILETLVARRVSYAGKVITVH